MSPSEPGPLATARNRLSSAIETSRLLWVAGTVEATLARWGRGSRIVRWFLVDTHQGVAVVDLRESYTLGPPIRLVTWARGPTRRLAERSGLDGVGSNTASRVDAAPLRWLGVVVATVALLGTLAGAVVSGGVSGWFLVVLGGGLLATRERRSLSELAETRLGRALEGAFEPPDEPGGGDG